MRALIIGATGVTGKDLVSIMLQDSAYTQVVIFVRKATGISHPKLTEVITNFDKLEEVSAQIQGDVWFSCLGTTLKAAGSKEKQWQIDYEIPLKFATLAKANHVPAAVLLSAYGASATSRVFYSEVKGKLEDAISKLAFEKYIIFKPGLLVRKDTDRAGERVMAGVLTFLNKLGIARKFKPLPTTLLAEKLAKAPKVLAGGMHVVQLDNVFTF